MVAAVPERGVVADRRDLDPAPPARRTAAAPAAPSETELGGPRPARDPARRDTESAAPGAAAAGHPGHYAALAPGHRPPPLGRQVHARQGRPAGDPPEHQGPRRWSLAGALLVVDEGVFGGGNDPLHLEVGHRPQRRIAQLLEQIAPGGDVVGLGDENVGGCCRPGFGVEPPDRDIVVSPQEWIYVARDDVLALRARQPQPGRRRGQVDEERQAKGAHQAIFARQRATSDHGLDLPGDRSRVTPRSPSAKAPPTKRPKSTRRLGRDDGERRLRAFVLRTRPADLRRCRTAHRGRGRQHDL